jgi:ABC-type antimicrobial peptide transport system permease subunit
MWNNYIILMIRKYKSWSGLSLINLLGMIAVYSLIVLLISGFLVSKNMLSLIVVGLIILVAGIAYINYISLQLRNRLKEFYIRKLLGARDNQIMAQLLLESVVLSAFLVISGMVLAEIISPWCDEIIGIAISVSSISFFAQVLIVILLVVPIGLLGVIFPIRSFTNYLNKNFSKFPHKPI